MLARMTRKDLPLLALLLPLFARPCASAATAAPPSTNVLLVLVDNLRPALGCYGDATAATPAFDALAAAATATLFANANAQVAWCAPSRNSLLSGRRPRATRAYNFIDSFREQGVGSEWVTLPGYFLAQGYYVTGVGKVFHPLLPPNDDFPQSWSDVPFAPSKDACPGGTMTCALPAGDAGVDAAVADEAIARLARRPAGQPFFLALGLQGPRLPWAFSEAEAARLPPAATFPLAENRSAAGLAPLEYFRPTEIDQYADVRNVTHAAPMADPQQRAVRRAYYATIAGADTQFARVWAAVEAAGAANNTIVALAADHGQSLGELNLWSMMGLLDTSTRVPLIVRLPPGAAAAGAAPQPRVWREPVELVDLYPTLAALAGLPPPPAGWALAGTDLSPVFSGGVVGKDAAYSQISRCRNCTLAYANLSAQCTYDAAADVGFSVPCALADRTAFDAMGLSVRTRDWRFGAYCRWDGARLAPDLANCSEANLELFDHRGDFAAGVPFFRAEAEGQNLALEPALRGVRDALFARLVAQFG
jgi:iduronate 2-sulfatase